MPTPRWTPRRRPPPPLPSSALFGLEKVVPPGVSAEHLPFRSSGSTPYSSTSDFNKPLPQSPKRSTNSSVYSGDSGYTKIIQSYANRDEEDQPVPTIIQPNAYRDTIAALLGHREDARCGLESPPAVSQAPRHSRSIPSFRLTRDRSPALSTYKSRHAPSFSEFSRNMQNRRMDSVSPNSPGSSHDPYQISYGHLSPLLPYEHQDYRRSYDQHHQYLPGPISGTITDIVDPGIIPQPLDLNRATTLIERYDTQLKNMSEQQGVPTHLIDIKEAQQRRLEEKERDMDNRRRELMEAKRQSHAPHLIDIKEAQRRAQELKRSAEPLPDAEPHRWSYKSDSFVIYTGFRESIKAMIKEAIRKKKEDRQMMRERKRVMSIAEEKYPAMKLVPAQEERKYSWVSSRKSSLQEGVNNVFRNLSISGSLAGRRGKTKDEGEEEPERGRLLERGRRQKQLAIPPSPYQKYGADIWYAKNKKKNAKTKRVQRTPTRMLRAKYEPETTRKQQHVRKMSEEVAENFQNGRSQLIGVLSGPKDMLHRKTSGEKRRLKHSIKVVCRTRSEDAGKEDGWV